MKSNRIEGGVVVFRFQGGPRDRDEIRSDVPTDKDSTSEAVTYWAMTKGGRLGSVLKTTAGGSIGDLISGGIQIGGAAQSTTQHRYRIVDRIEKPDEILLIAEFDDSPESPS